MKKRIKIYLWIGAAILAIQMMTAFVISAHYRIENQRISIEMRETRIAEYRQCIKTAFPQLRHLFFGIYTDRDGNKWNIRNTDDEIDCRMRYLAAND